MSDSKFLVNIPNDEREDGRTQDAIKYKKNCDDFQCLEDGTITKECKYCNLSLVCRQVDILLNGETIGMESHYLPIIHPETKEVLEWQYFCTGMHDLRPLKERAEDNKVS